MAELIENTVEGRLSGDAFERFLSALDPAREVAGDKYIDLCFKLRKFFARRGCRESDIDELVDETVDRTAKKLGDREVIENINTYSVGVARNVWFEYTRKRTEESLEDDPPDKRITETPEEVDKRYECLDRCLAKLTSEDRELILGYYDVEENEKNKDNRKSLAERVGKSSGALKVHATRLREKLRRGIADCLKSKRM